MSLNITNVLASQDARDRDLENVLAETRQFNQRKLDGIILDLIKFGVQQGYNENQIRNAIEALFRTFVNEWFLYVFIGADDIVTSITNDATLAWLDMDASGQTIRTRLVNRLT